MPVTQPGSAVHQKMSSACRSSAKRAGRVVRDHRVVDVQGALGLAGGAAGEVQQRRVLGPRRPRSRSRRTPAPAAHRSHACPAARSPRRRHRPAARAAATETVSRTGATLRSVQRGRGDQHAGRRRGSVRVAIGSGPNAENSGDTTAPAFSAPSTADVRRPAGAAAAGTRRRRAARPVTRARWRSDWRRRAVRRSSCCARRPSAPSQRMRDTVGARTARMAIDRLEGDVQAAARQAGRGRPRVVPAEVPGRLRPVHQVRPDPEQGRVLPDEARRMVAGAEAARSDFTLEAAPHFPLMAVKRAALKARPPKDTTAMPRRRHRWASSARPVRRPAWTSGGLNRCIAAGPRPRDARAVSNSSYGARTHVSSRRLCSRSGSCMRAGSGGRTSDGTSVAPRARAFPAQSAAARHGRRQFHLLALSTSDFQRPTTTEHPALKTSTSLPRLLRALPSSGRQCAVAVQRAPLR